MKKAEARRSRFVEAFIQNGGNGREAAISAGYKPGRAADKAAERMSQNVAVSQEIERRRAQALAKAQEETGLTVAGTLRELHGIVHSDLRKAFDPKTGALLPPHLWPDDVARAMASVKVVEMAGGMKVDGEDGITHVPMYTKEVKFWDKNSAIEKAMKTLGLFEKDNAQRTDPLAALMAAIAARDTGIRVRPR
jgi:phage terminase small subunit